MYDAEFERQVDEIVARYPQPRGAVLPVLHLVQEKVGYVPLDAELWAAQRLGLTPSFVHGIVSFYTMFRTSECGRYLLQVCTTVSCMLRGCDRVLEHVTQILQSIPEVENTSRRTGLQLGLAAVTEAKTVGVKTAA